MTIEEFKNTFEITFGEPKTTDSGKVTVRFNQRQVILKNRVTGQQFDTGITVEVGSEEFGEVLALERFAKDKKDK
jgi:hypothetical protein